MTFLPINEDNLLSEKRLAWLTKECGTSEIMLYQIMERTYNHPDAIRQMTITSIEVIYVETRKRIDPQASTWLLIEANQRAIYEEML